MKTFQTLDAAVREAEKSLRESERLAHLLTRVERDMARQQAALSRAATALKWKTADLRQTEGFSLEAVYQRLRGRQKEWREDVRQAHAAALAQYAQSREKLASLEAERDALSAQLAALADAPQQVEAVRRRQAAFLMARGGEVGELTAVFDRLAAVRAELGQLVPVLAAGRQAMAQLAQFAGVVGDPAVWAKRNGLILGELWSMPLELLIMALAESPESRLAERMRVTQESLDTFQAALADLGRQFWPPPSIKPVGRLGETAQGWRYQVQMLQGKVAARVLQLETDAAEKAQAAQALDLKLCELVGRAWPSNPDRVAV